MTENFKPGDVAILPANLAEPRTVFLTIHRGWVDTDGDPRAAAENYPDDLRRLVVIDPEDREQVERLTKVLVEAMYAHGKHGHAANGMHPDDVTEALREFATPTPPRPDEPTGLGAVVEDVLGQKWTRVPLASNERPWFCDGAWFDYADIAAVRVLSEGITP